MGERTVNTVFETVRALAAGHDLDWVAHEAAQSITQTELLEIQKLHRPPVVVQRVIELTCLILGAIRSRKPKQLPDDFSELAKNIVAKSFMPSVLSYDAAALRRSPRVVEYIFENYFTGETALSFERVKYASPATAALFQWCAAILAQASIEAAPNADIAETPADDDDEEDLLETLEVVEPDLNLEVANSEEDARPLWSDVQDEDVPSGRGDDCVTEDDTKQEDDLATWIKEALARGLVYYVMSCVICLLCVLLLLALLWRSSGSCRTDLVKYAHQAVVADCSQFAPASAEGQITIVSCPIQTQSLPISTPLTSFNMPGLQNSVSIPSVAAAQKVEMYQCIEKVQLSPSSILEVAPMQQANNLSMVIDASGLLVKKRIIRRAERRAKLSSKVNGAFGPSSTGRNVRRSSTISQRADLVPELLDEYEQAVGRKTHTAAQPAYTYEMGWADVWYDVTTFKQTPQYIHQSGCPEIISNGQVQNNPRMPDRGDGHPAELGKQTSYATSTNPGAFTFNDEHYMKTITTDIPIPMTPFAAMFSLPPQTDNFVTAIILNTVAAHATSPYYLSTCNNDRLGCIRISYNTTSVSHITVLGLTGGSGVLSPIPVEEADGCDMPESFIRMWPRAMSKDDVIAALQEEQK